MYDCCRILPVCFSQPFAPRSGPFSCFPRSVSVAHLSSCIKPTKRAALSTITHVRNTVCSAICRQARLNFGKKLRISRSALLGVSTAACLRLCRTHGAKKDFCSSRPRLTERSWSLWWRIGGAKRSEEGVGERSWKYETQKAEARLFFYLLFFFFFHFIRVYNTRNQYNQKTLKYSTFSPSPFNLKTVPNFLRFTTLTSVFTYIYSYMAMPIFYRISPLRQALASPVCRWLRGVLGRRHVGTWPITVFPVSVDWRGSGLDDAGTKILM